MSIAFRFVPFRLLRTVAVGAALLLPVTLSFHAQAYWRGSVWVGINPAMPYYAPPPVYVPPPVIYAPPPPLTYAPYPYPAYPYPVPRVWVPPYWNGWRWIPGHWRYY
jgi:hypothetical protein